MPREIVTKGARFYCVSLQPDICKTPIGPSTPAIPYTIKGEFSDATGVSPSITSNGEPVVIDASTVIPTVTGDEPGTAKGVKSGTVAKRVQHDQKSSTVSFNGERAIRVGDTVFMNDKNTIGKVFERAGSATSTAAKTAGEQLSPAAADSQQGRESAGAMVPDFASAFERVMALVANPKSAIAELARNALAVPVDAAQEKLQGGPASISSDALKLIKAGNVKGIAHDLMADGAKRILEESPAMLNVVRSSSAFIPKALLNRVPGAKAVSSLTADVLAKPCPSGTLGQASGTFGYEAHSICSQGRPAVEKWIQVELVRGGAGRARPQEDAGDGGSSRGRSQPQLRSPFVSPTIAVGAISLPLEQSLLQDEVRDKNGRLIPPDIKEYGEINYRMVNNGNLTYSKTDYGETMEIQGYVEDRGTRQGAAAVAAFNRAFTTIVRHEGKTLSIKTQMTLAKDTGQIAKSVFALVPCSDCESAETYYVGGRANLGGFPNHVMYLSKRADTVTYGHEFGHILGLPHWHPYTDSIMAYDGKTQAGKTDVLRLFEMYRNPDAYWRKRQRQM